MPLPVLIIDDSPLVVRSILRLLVQNGFQGVQATTAQEGLFVISQAPLHAVVSDFDLGGRIDGLDLLTLTRKAQPDAVRVLMSAEPPTSLSLAIAAGDVQHFLPKPFTSEALLACLRA